MIKLSICPDCGGWVASAAWGLFSESNKIAFRREAEQAGLSMVDIEKKDYLDYPICDDTCPRLTMKQVDDWLKANQDESCFVTWETLRALLLKFAEDRSESR